MRFTHFTVGFQWILNVQFVFNFSLDLWTESRSMNQIKQHHTFLVHRYGRAHHIDFEHSAFSIGDHLHSVPSGGYGLHRKHRPDTVVLAAVGGGYTVQVPSRKIFKRRPWNKRVVPVHQDDVLLLVNGKLEGHSVVLLDWAHGASAALNVHCGTMSHHEYRWYGQPQNGQTPHRWFTGPVPECMEHSDLYRNNKHCVHQEIRSVVRGVWICYNEGSGDCKLSCWRSD